MSKKSKINIFAIAPLLIMATSSNMLASSVNSVGGQKVFPNYKIEQVSKLVNKANKIMFDTIQKKTKRYQRNI